jgi:hypothetical protein
VDSAEIEEGCNVVVSSVVSLTASVQKKDKHYFARIFINPQICGLLPQLIRLQCNLLRFGQGSDESTYVEKGNGVEHAFRAYYFGSQL